MSESRKLAAILVSDVVGYSRLAGADEGRTLARLRGLRSDLIDPAIDAITAGSSSALATAASSSSAAWSTPSALRSKSKAAWSNATRACRGPPHRVSHRHSSGRRGRGERRRPDGRRRQYRRAPAGGRQAGRDLSVRGRLSSGQGAGSIWRSPISVQRNSRTSPNRSGCIRLRSARPPVAKPAAAAKTPEPKTPVNASAADSRDRRAHPSRRWHMVFLGANRTRLVHRRPRRANPPSPRIFPSSCCPSRISRAIRARTISPTA